jgi:PAS domain S-box-containing protein
MADGLLLADLDGKVWQVNRRAEEILGIVSRQILGTRIEMSLRHQELATLWASALDEEAPVTADIRLPTGPSIQATISVCRSSADEPIGRMLTLRDVTREKRIQIELSTEVARRLVELADDGSRPAELLPITIRERQILDLLVDGMSNLQIADRLHVSQHTVASHLKNLYPKLGVNSRAQAVAYAMEHGLRPHAR